MKVMRRIKERGRIPRHREQEKRGNQDTDGKEQDKIKNKKDILGQGIYVLVGGMNEDRIGSV